MANGAHRRSYKCLFDKEVTRLFALCPRANRLSRVNIDDAHEIDGTRLLVTVNK